jgi:acyl-CoA synthetase (AMP-forming)/AMP-acid ligase II
MQASVVGLRDDKYGEIVAAFIGQEYGSLRPSNCDLQNWVADTLGSHKTPVHIFWLGDQGVFNEFPATGSGKIKKNELRELGNRLIYVNGVKSS